MSKAAVTAQLQQYLDPKNSGIPNLGTVYTGLPRLPSEADLFRNDYSGLSQGAIIFLFCTGQHERRIALGGPHSGHKMVYYDYGMLIVFKSMLTGADSVQEAQSDFDGFIDHLTTFMRDSRTAGSAPSTGGGVVWQWGEGTELGGPDINIEYQVPRTLSGGVTLFQAVLRVSVLEDLVNT